MPEQMGGQAVPGPAMRGVCAPARELLCLCPASTWGWLAGRDLLFPRALVMSGACEDKGEQEAWKQQRSRKERSQVLKSDAFSLLSHRYRNAGGLAEAYFHPETPPHVPELLGCVCC